VRENRARCGCRYVRLFPRARAQHGIASGRGYDDEPMIDLLLARGARSDARDTMWDGAPLDWAIHEQRESARIRLERIII
jgi:hypothetical protein